MQHQIKIKLTKEGFEDLQKEQQNLLLKRPQVVINLTNAREQGDLSENAGYHAAKEELSQIDSRVREIKHILTIAKITQVKTIDKVEFGSTVKIDDGLQITNYTIVSNLEADPAKGKMSDVSPIGSALLGKKVGDIVNIKIPSGNVEYKILEIKI
ncbi:hypothetical protein A3A48_01180 [Candidatus Curtissbacteria bacterium RIFCSPLOWO2_01_FULL_37_9]|uniref:Transcription elongation factor GreA n=1 Tax=Candidatus Curtissbacteria bacterium RIFCSPLOWO2_01_FULL_37_9 TaxID=1797724 RepID=A0A1F5GSQ5_9BACT|nr:MAG: hypothetical protein A3A48_01180 [Candidatus Curtissbacteria bacterium RIFCSPLOWO2_01_FULL_37_9]